MVEENGRMRVIKAMFESWIEVRRELVDDGKVVVKTGGDVFAVMVEVDEAV